MLRFIVATGLVAPFGRSLGADAPTSRFFLPTWFIDREALFVVTSSQPQVEISSHVNTRNHEIILLLFSTLHASALANWHYGTWLRQARLSASIVW